MKALLVLEDGFALSGESFTGPIEGRGGEAVFNTSMTGYEELLTDPVCKGQMLCLTYPLIGNYGINARDMESDDVQVSALLVRECCKEPSNWRSEESLPNFLMRHGIPGVEGLDTRALARHLLKAGSQRAFLSTAISDVEELAAEARSLPPFGEQNFVSSVAAKGIRRWEDGKAVPAELNADGFYAWRTGGPHVVVMDFGVRRGFLRLLSGYGMELLIVSPSFSAEQILRLGSDALVYSDGPGNPALLKKEAEESVKMIGSLPMAGTGLGFHLLGIALGGNTERLSHGRHGVNCPVRDLRTGKVAITAQNCNYRLLSPEGVEITHANLNDGSVEGFRYPSKPLFARQPIADAAFAEDLLAMIGK